MDFFKKHKDNLLFVPLGGAKEIGLNLNLYQYQGKWIMIDLGIGFISGVPGVDIIVPNIQFLKRIKKDVLGLIITHAHEDHFGAVQHLWRQIPVPIYTSKFTGLFLKEKLKEYQLDKKVPINILEEGASFSLKGFDLELVEINHSVPEMNALVIKAGEQTIFHSGDWKFDHNPVLGKVDDFKKLANIGKEGVTAFVGDSTNVFSKGHSGSEGDLQKSLIKLISKQKNLVVVSTFASNLSRVLTLIEAAKKTKRKVVLCGRSLLRIQDIAKKIGYIKDSSIFIEREQVKRMARNKILVIATGCQGEEKASIRKMAENKYPFIKLQKDDTIILSSKIIPGNELKISESLNLLSRRKVNVITEKDEFVHVSGHPNQEELRKMYNLIKPNTAIPVHGEEMHINKHGQFAKEIGIKNIVTVTNGSCVLIEKNNSGVIGNVANGYLAVDGSNLIDLKGSILKVRKKISQNGIVNVLVQFNKDGELKADPVINPLGLYDEIQDQKKIASLVSYLAKILKPSAVLKKDKSPDKDKIIKIVSSELKNKIYKESLKSPVIDVFVV